MAFEPMSYNCPLASGGRSETLSMNRTTLATFVLVTFAAASAAGDAKPRKPRLDVRATPRMTFSPAHVLLTAELTGGDDLEDYHCPEIEWDWDDGGKSVHEADCTPFEAGVTRIERRFTANHVFRKAGTYDVKVTMRRSNRPLARSTVRITVRPGLGDRTIEQ